MNCWWVKFVWFSCPLNINFNNINQTHFVDWFKNNFGKMTQGQLDMLIHIINNIWNARNKAIYDNKDVHVI